MEGGRDAAHGARRVGDRQPFPGDEADRLAVVLAQLGERRSQPAIAAEALGGVAGRRVQRELAAPRQPCGGGWRARCRRRRRAMATAARRAAAACARRRRTSRRRDPRRRHARRAARNTRRRRRDGPRRSRGTVACLSHPVSVARPPRLTGSLARWPRSPSKWTDSGGAYIELADGEVRDSVQLDELEDAGRIVALESLVLHFDFYGRLIGSRSPAAPTSALPPGLLDQAE